MRATAHDVARLAGVSVSTVSRALGAPNKVSSATRARVEEAAQGLGYRPNRAARGLATGRTGNIGLIIPDLENPYFSSLTKAIHNRAHAVGFDVFVADTDEDQRQERDLIRNLARQVDGVILCSPRMPDAELAACADEARMVLLNRLAPGMVSIAPDNADGVRQALRHLWALGHRDVAYVGGPATSWSDRARRGAVETVGAEFDGLQTKDLGAYKPYFAGGVAAADIVLASPATAVVVYNDLMALGLLDRTKTRRVAVPDELSIVSFDNIMFARAVTPNLTTVSIPTREMARLAIDLLLSPDEAPERAQVLEHVVPVDLMVRDSTGPAPDHSRTYAR